MKNEIATALKPPCTGIYALFSTKHQALQPNTKHTGKDKIKGPENNIFLILGVNLGLYQIDIKNYGYENFLFNIRSHH